MEMQWSYEVTGDHPHYDPSHALIPPAAGSRWGLRTPKP
jgi:hypothetical protein